METPTNLYVFNQNALGEQQLITPNYNSELSAFFDFLGDSAVVPSFSAFIISRGPTLT